MTLLEQILKASANPQSNDEPLDYPFTLTTQSIIPNLKPPSENPFAPLQPLTGFQISQSDSDLIAASSDFYKKLKRKLKSPQSLTSNSFIKTVNSYFERIGEIKLGGLDGLVAKGGDSDEGYCCKLVEKLGSFAGRDVMGLLIEGCVLLGDWRVLETLIVNKLVVDNGVRSDLLYRLVSKGKCDLVCLCLRHFGDLEALDLGRVLKCFLSPSKDGCSSMVSVRDEWERDATSAIDKVSEKKSNGKKFGLAKEAALLLMVAYDQFSPSELCLHFVLSSSNVDEVVFSSAVSKLNAGEMLGFIKYLGKWLRKYERFPQVGPCPKAAAKLGLSMCQWVPRLEDVVKALGLVVDEHFSSLALHSEFHEELKAVNGVVSSLVSEGRLCCSVANVIESLKPEIGDVVRPLIAVDIERHYYRDESRRHITEKVVVVKLCFDKTCLIIQLLHMRELPRSLTEFLQLQEQSFVGVGIKQCLDALSRDYGIKCRNATDLGHLTATFMNHPTATLMKDETYKSCGLLDLAYELKAICSMQIGRILLLGSGVAQQL